MKVNLKLCKTLHFILQETYVLDCILYFKKHMFWIFVRIDPKHMFFEEIRIKQGLSYIPFRSLRTLSNNKTF